MLFVKNSAQIGSDIELGKTGRILGLGWLCLLAVAVSGFAATTPPRAELPRVYIDTTYKLPTGGTTWAAHTSAQFSSALRTSRPGDVIVLDAGVTYSGNFTLPDKSNPDHKWIYITSSQYAKLPAPGARVAPGNAANMPKIQTPNATTTFSLSVSAPAANYWRLVGLEITAASNYPANCGTTTNCMSYGLIQVPWPPTATPDHIFIDRCYIHGGPTQDIQGAVGLNGSNMAIVDSYVDDIHNLGTDSWGVGASISPGPIKIVNNYIVASSENIIFGGGGGGYLGYVPSDIEIRNNYLYKPLSWIPLSVTQNKMVIKNAFELKSAQRVLFDHNTIENVWAHGQLGSAVVLTVRTGQGGDFAVVNDVTVTNNILKNVARFVNTSAADDTCGIAPYAACKNAGSQARWNISNNLVIFYDPTTIGGTNNVGIAFQPGFDRIHGGVGGQIHDVVFQHNTLIQNGSHPCWAGVYFGVGNFATPPSNGLTSNIWILDNVLCGQPYGSWGFDLTALTKYMGMPNVAPNDVTQRYYGNVMYVPTGTKVQVFTPHNYSTTLPFAFVDPARLNYQLMSPYWTDTSDGSIAGIKAAQTGIALPVSAVRR